ncbi:DNA-binding transcriptional activator PspC [Citrobacter koseri]|uniref:DNA-binding transcriptional activator PspC n=1 Tax=Citrobacter koseri TaxID=545 RepID=A0A447UFQ4_CITKO|nr:DNA-binding transcriptional activator PspC [Citrobacter koseri]
MGGINLNKKLWRMPQQGMVRGVCAGIAQYLDVPVKLVRILVVLSIFFGLAFFTLVAYNHSLFCTGPDAGQHGNGRATAFQR